MKASRANIAAATAKATTTDIRTTAPLIWSTASSAFSSSFSLAAAPDPDLAILRHLDFADLGKITAHSKLNRDSAAHARRERIAPSSLLDSEIEHAEPARRFAEQSTAEFDGVFLRCRGQLVDKALDHEDIMRRADAAPPAGREAGGLDANVVHQDVRNRIRQLFRRSVDGIFIEAVDEGRRGPARQD